MDWSILEKGSFLCHACGSSSSYCYNSCVRDEWTNRTDAIIVSSKRKASTVCLAPVTIAKQFWKQSKIKLAEKIKYTIDDGVAICSPTLFDIPRNLTTVVGNSTTVATLHHAMIKAALPLASVFITCKTPYILHALFL